MIFGTLHTKKIKIKVEIIIVFTFYFLLDFCFLRAEALNSIRPRFTWFLCVYSLCISYFVTFFLLCWHCHALTCKKKEGVGTGALGMILVSSFHGLFYFLFIFVFSLSLSSVDGWKGLRASCLATRCLPRICSHLSKTSGWWKKGGKGVLSGSSQSQDLWSWPWCRFLSHFFKRVFNLRHKLLQL